MAPTDVKPDGAHEEMEDAQSRQAAIKTLNQDGAVSDDEAMRFERFNEADQEWHRAMTKKVMWKVDLHLLPMLSLMYLLNFLDRK